jgi:hypothetical protein
VWAERRGVAPEVYAALAKSGGDPDRWYVVERAVRAFEVVRIDIGAVSDDNGKPLLSPQSIEGAALRKLFERRGRQRALGLIEARLASR